MKEDKDDYKERSIMQEPKLISCQENTSQCYWRGRFFENLEDLLQHIKEWPDAPFDFMEFLDDLSCRNNTVRMNLRGGLSNGQMYKLIGMTTGFEKDYE